MPIPLLVVAEEGVIVPVVVTLLVEAVSIIAVNESPLTMPTNVAFEQFNSPVVVPS